jgi:hypothetical protein
MLIGVTGLIRGSGETLKISLKIYHLRPKAEISQVIGLIKSIEIRGQRREFEDQLENLSPEAEGRNYTESRKCVSPSGFCYSYFFYLLYQLHQPYQPYQLYQPYHPYQPMN